MQLRQRVVMSLIIIGIILSVVGPVQAVTQQPHSTTKTSLWCQLTHLCTKKTSTKVLDATTTTQKSSLIRELYCVFNWKKDSTCIEYRQSSLAQTDAYLEKSLTIKSQTDDTGVMILEVAALKGDKGDQGEKGDKGEPGQIGLTGPMGPQGILGIAAAKGDKGDKGDQGLSGNGGAKGDKGDKGEPGTSAVLADGSLTFAKWASNSCTDEQVPKFNSTSGEWECGNDGGGTTFTASEQGLTVSGSQFGLELDGTSLSLSASGLKIADTYDDNFAITTGAYANPNWITSLAGSKISGNISGNAATVTNGIYTTTDFGGDVSGTYDALILDNSGVSAGTYGNSGANVTQLTIDAKGRVTTAINRTLTKSDLSLGNVENTALSLWAGSINITTLGTIGAGTWHGSDITLGTYTSGNYVASVTNGTGITGGSTGSEGAALTLSLNINGLTGSSTVASDDYIPMYDTSGSTTFKVSRSDFLSGILGSLNYQGTWDNSSTATPETCNAGADGHYWVATVDAANGYSNKDWAICNGTSWEKLTNSNNVISVFGRTGTITADAGDYTALKITNTANGNIAATTVQAALNELDSEKLAFDGSITSLDVPDYTGNAGKILTVNGTANGVVWTAGLTTSLASGNLYVGNSEGTATAVAVSGDATLGNTGVLTIANNAITSAKISDGVIVNADISDSAAIADTKLATISTTGKVAGSSVQLGTNPGLQDSTGLMIKLNGSTLSLAAAGLSFNLANANTWSGTQTFSNALVAPTSSNTINGLIINAGALSGAATLSLSGAITGATSTNTINGLVINAGALSSVTSITGSGALAITSGGTNAVSVDSNSTGAVNIGTGSEAKAINIASGPAGNTVSIATDDTTADTVTIGSAKDTVTVKGNIVLDGNVTVNGNILPGTNNTYDLGSSDKQWAEIYASTNTIYIGGVALSNNSGSLTWNGSAVGGGSSSTTMQSVSADATLAGWTRTVKTDATSGSVVVTLPTAVGNNGQIIEVMRTDNSTNTVRIVPNGSQTINGSTNAIYLYSQNDSIVLRSDGTNSYIVADNRSSVGATADRMVVTYSGSTGMWPNGGIAPIGTNSQVSQEGTTFSISGNVITVKAGKRVRLTGPSGGQFTAGNGSNRNYWALSGQTTMYEPSGSSAASGFLLSVQAAGSDTPNQPAVLEFTPTTDTQLVLYSYSSNSTFVLNEVFGLITAEVLSTPQNVVNTVDYGIVRYTGADTASLSINAAVPFDSALQAGNMTYGSNKFTLIAGKTYELESQIQIYNTSGAAAGVFEFYDYTNSSTLPGAHSIEIGVDGAGTGHPNQAGILKTMYTPMQNIQVGVRLTSSYGQAPGIVGSAGIATGGASGATYFKVTQIGSTASTGVALNSLINATATGALDNQNYGQAWDWSTATTQTGLTMTGNTLTSGGLLALTSSSANATGNISSINISNAGASAKGLSIANVGTGLSMDVQGAVAFKAGTTYTTAGSANNVSFGNASLIKLDTSGAAQAITGIAGGADGKILTLMNVDAANAVTLSNNSASSSDGNKILTGTGADLTLAANASVMLQYDSTGTAATSYWRVIGGTGNGGDIAGGMGVPDYTNGESRSTDTVYQASTDGYLSALFYGSLTNDLYIYVGSTNPPTTVAWRQGDDQNNYTKWGSAMIPIKSGDYYKVTQGYDTVTVKFYPAIEGADQWTSNGTALYYNSGKVGIGTTSPTEALTVSSGAILVRPDSVWSNGDVASVYLGDTSSYFSNTNGGGVAFVSNNPLNLTTSVAQPIIFNINTAEKMRIDNTGNVGIGTTDPSVALDVTGDIEYTGIISDVSDARQKENIVSLDSSLEKLMKLNAISFNMIGSDAEELGFTAQNVQVQFPELVSVVDPENGILGLNYIGLIAPIVKSIQEQQSEIETTLDSIVALDLRTKNVVEVQDGKTVFKGTVVANTLKANKIEGLDFVSGAEMNDVDAKLVVQGQTLNNISEQLALLEAKITGKELSLKLEDLEVSGGVTFKENVQFQGPAMFKAIVEFIDKVIFKNDVTLEKQLCFKKTDGTEICLDGDKVEQIINLLPTPTPIEQPSAPVKDVIPHPSSAEATTTVEPTLTVQPLPELTIAPTISTDPEATPSASPISELIIN